MATKVSIGIDAQLDAAGVKQGIDKITQHVAQANKQKLNPVDKSTLANLDAVNRKFQELLKVNRELNRRVNATGQSGAMFQDIDFASIFPDQKTRNRKISQISQHVGIPSANLGPGIQPHPGRNGGGGFGAIAGQVAQAGLRATGPAGGVAAGALGTGMASGAGAGLMGLLGGMMALGVGKLVSGVMDKVEQAETNNVAMDKLKRTLGDVNVSFDALKSVVKGSADGLKITYSEAGRLATQFAKLGNVSSGQYKSVGGELGVGVGLSRSFGLEPEQGVGVMGEMRGIGVTKNLQDSKRFALLIGETIAKSDAFSKADEVISAMGAFAVSQTRTNMGRANVEGYGGMFSAMVGSGIPGLDPAGAAGMLSKINSSLSAGGAKGEASQYFTGAMGQSLGMNPFQTQIWREGGMHATPGDMFGKNSAYFRYMGKTGPMAGGDLYGETKKRLQQQYGGNSDYEKMMLANAFANHTGLNMNQSMALLPLEAKQMGQLSKYGDLKNFNGAGIANLGKIEFGTAGDRKAIANSLYARKDISETDRKSLAGYDNLGEADQKKMLGQMVAQYEQERTLGSDIRDSKNLLDNVKTNLADKLVPYMNEMRHGIMYMAGVKDGKSPREIVEAVLRAEGKDKLSSVDRQFGGKQNATQSALDAIRKQKENLTLEYRKQYGKFTNDPGEYERQMKELTEKEIVAAEANNKAKEAYTAAMKKAEQEIEDGINDSKLGLAPGTTSARRQAIIDGSNESAAETHRLRRSGIGASPMGATSIDASLAVAEKRAGLPAGTLRSVMQQEVGGNTDAYLKDPSKYHYQPDASGRRKSSAFGPFGILESTAKNPGYGVDPLKDKSIEEQTRFAAEYLAARSKSAGSLAGGLAGYGEGTGYSNSVMSRIKGGTPIPSSGTGTQDAGSTAAGSDKVASIRVELVHFDKNGTEHRPRQIAETRVKSNWAQA